MYRWVVLATLFEEQGARVAYNLDGGGSAILVFNGKILNDPRDTDGTQKVRAVTKSYAFYTDPQMLDQKWYVPRILDTYQKSNDLEVGIFVQN